MAVHPDGRPQDMRAVVDALVRHLEAHQQVPTMRRVSELAHSLIPDKESPVPLEPRTAPPVEDAFTYDQGTQPAVRAHDTTESAMPPVHRTMPRGHAPIDDDADDTMVASRPPVEALSVPVVDGAASFSQEATRQAPLPPERQKLFKEETAIEKKRRPPKRKSTSRGRQLLLFLGSATLVLGVGIAAFVTARAISGRAPQARDERPTPVPIVADAAPEPPEPRLLNVTSEPDGAEIYIDGERQPLPTPALVQLPHGRDRVVVRTVLEGYVAQERPIHATAGEARFVLVALSPPDASADAEADAAADAGPATATMRRPRMRRPRMRRR
jgi:hypothetical protein